MRADTEGELCNVIIFAAVGDCPGAQEEGPHGDAAASVL